MDVLRGDDAANVLEAGPQSRGRNLLDGRGGDDLLRVSSGEAHGGPGNDVFLVRKTGVAVGAGGNDRFVMRGGTSRGGVGKDLFEVLTKGGGRADGGKSADIITFEKVKRGVKASLRGGKATWGDRVVTIASIEVMKGTRKADLLEGTNNGDFLNGLGGNDRLKGLGGNDLLLGGKGFDVGDGGSGGDVCVTESKPRCEA